MSSVYGGPMGARDDDCDNQDEYTNLVMDKIRAIEALNISKETIHQYCHMLLTGLNCIDEMIQPVRKDVEQIKTENANKKPKTAFTLFPESYYELCGTRYAYAVKACDNMMKWLREYGELNIGPARLAQYWDDYLCACGIYEWRDPDKSDMQDFAEWLSEKEL